MESLQDLQREHPREWNRLLKKVVPLIRDNRIDEMNELVRQFSGSKTKSKILRSILEAYSDTVLTGSLDKQIKLRPVEAWLLQKLFFFGDSLLRKAASPLGFRLVWPRIRDKGIFLSLAAAQGMYCFYSKKLLHRLIRLIGSRSCLEIGAGDGALSHLLLTSGVSLKSTDDYSWSKQIRFPSWVENLSADKALSQYSPEVVLCSWPPADNQFESCVFRTSSVQTYIVLGSKVQGATGSLKAYQAARDFECKQDTQLTSAIYPPELNPVAYIFERRTKTADGHLRR